MLRIAPKTAGIARIVPAATVPLPAIEAFPFGKPPLHAKPAYRTLRNVCRSSRFHHKPLSKRSIF